MIAISCKCHYGYLRYTRRVFRTLSNTFDKALSRFCFVGNYFCISSPPEVFLAKGDQKNMQQIYRRTPMPKCDFNKFAKQIY